MRRYSPAGRDYPLNFIHDRIAQVEEDFGYGFFGTEFYTYLLDNLTDVPTDVPDWNDCNVYAIDDKVQVNGCVFISLIANNTTDPLDSTNTWKEYPKFDVDCLNTLWENYLRKYLALRIYAGSLTYSTHTTGAGGLVIRGGGNVQTGNITRVANKTELQTVISELMSDSDMIRNNMLRWIYNNRTACNFSCILALDGSPRIKQSGGRRRWAFR